MKNFLLASAVFLIAGSAMANTSYSGSLSASAYVDDHSGNAATIAVVEKDLQINCGTLDYFAATPAVTHLAGSGCPSIGTAPTAELDVTESASTPYYMTLTDTIAGQSAANTVTLTLNGAGTHPFGLDLDVTIDGAPYTTGTYITTGGLASTILITPKFHADFPTLGNLQPTGQYSGASAVFISF